MSPRISALLGAAVCLAFALTRVPGLGHTAWATALLLFASLVLVPLALEVVVETDDPPALAPWFSLARWTQFPAALLLAVSCWLEPGAGGVGFAAPWFAFTLLLAAIGMRRLRAAGMRRSLHGMCGDVALIFSAVGGAWALADRAAYRPLDFDAAIVSLTAVHFHYAGLLLPLFAGLVQREYWMSRFAARAAVGVVLGVPAVAIGIVASQLGSGPAIEAAAGVGLALAGMAVGILQVRRATERNGPPLARWLLGVSGAALFCAMVLAAAYAVRSMGATFAWLGLPQMRALHGTLNAFGFGLCGVLGWRMLGRDANVPPV